LGDLPKSEIEKIGLFHDLPEELSFPLFHPKHFYKVKEVLQMLAYRNTIAYDENG
jgi:hypothetical protein